MQESTAAPRYSRRCGAIAAALALGLCAAQATAATDDVLCDDVSKLKLNSPVAELSELIVDVIDHGTTSALSADDSAQTLDDAASTAAPLTELRLPVERERSTEDPETDATTVDSTEDFNTRLPGTSEEDVRRYRRQMYRTDI